MFQYHLPPLTNILYLCLDIYARYFTNFYYPTFYIFVDVSDKLLKRRKCNSNGKNNVLYSHIFFAIDRHDITEILMKVELITITLTPLQLINVQMMVFVTHNYLIYQELA